MPRPAGVALLLLRGLSPVCAGALVGGWSPWVCLPAVPALALGALGRPYLGLALAVVAEAALLAPHGAPALLLLLALWLAWLPATLYHLLGALLLTLAGWLAGATVTGVLAWLSALAVLISVLVQMITRMGRMRRMGRRDASS